MSLGRIVLCHYLLGSSVWGWGAWGCGCYLHFQQVSETWAILQKTFKDEEGAALIGVQRVAPDGAFSTWLGIQLHSTALHRALIRPDGLIGCHVVRLCWEEVTNNKIILLTVSLAGVASIGSWVGQGVLGRGSHVSYKRRTTFLLFGCSIE